MLSCVVCVSACVFSLLCDLHDCVVLVVVLYIWRLCWFAFGCLF